MQRALNFLDISIPEIQVWETLEEEQRILALEVLARVIVKTTFNHPGSEEDHDR